MAIFQRQAICLTLTLACLAGVAKAVIGAGPTDQEVRFFEEQVRPVLAEHCFKCHGDQAQRGDLRVDSLSGLLSGGESGPALAPGKPDESLLVEAIRYDSLEMPPDGKLESEQIAAITKWIEIGAPWPGRDGSVRIIRRRRSIRIVRFATIWIASSWLGSTPKA
jgi:mono/diheme cytochrome c family protein